MLRSVVAGVALVALAACLPGDRGQGQQKVGVVLNERGRRPRMIVYACPDESLTTASLWLMSPDGVDQVRLLWQIRGSSAPGRLVSVTAGETPTGFAQVRRLRAPLPTQSDLDFVAQIGRVEVDRQFDFRDLRKGQYLVDNAWFGGRYATLHEFRAEKSNDCHD
jgi:hypothetical protein